MVRDCNAASEWYHMYGTAQFKLEIYTCAALELFNKLVELLASYKRADDTISQFNP